MNIPNYFEQVYAGVLGKVIGVYMGRPFEGWTRDRIEGRWGVVDRYVHADCGVPLVVADDDISGTFTFVRAVEDSGLGAATPPEFFGETWLNYLIENRTILWWGGIGYSTEHTAYSQLKRGVPPPASGSAALNGRVVSEQIGAQIFIDAFGLVAPGNPALAMELAEKAARVSHDGEAVIGAKVVAAMVSLAFIDKDIHSILDKVLAMIPQDSLIARIHRDVRAWSAEDGDWRATYDRIREKYGYEKFGGGCHIVPNHAIMVMAWEYAGNDFREAQKIINTAGWDTDCNAANVGTVSALICGLDGLDASYGFHSHPEFADRVVIPTADGTESVTDCLQIARRITRVGCAISGIPIPEKVSQAAWHDFSLPGSLHGYVGRAPNARVSYSPLSGGSALMRFEAYPARPALCETPVSSAALNAGHYGAVSTPSIYHGTTIEAELFCDELEGDGEAYLEVACAARAGDDAPKTFRSEAVRLVRGEGTTIRWRIDCERRMVSSLRLAVASAKGCTGAVRLVRVDRDSAAEVEASCEVFTGCTPENVPGWICTFTTLNRWGRFLCDNADGILVTGNRDWQSASVSCRMNVHSAERAGIVLCHQGMRRGYLVVLSHGRLQVIRRLYGETILHDAPVGVVEDREFLLEASVSGGEINVSLDGSHVATVRDDALASGGAGLLLSRGCATMTAAVSCSK